MIVSDTHVDQYYFNSNLVEYFESDNANDLADKILHLVQDPNRRAALASLARMFIDENNWDVKKNEYLTLVDGLVARKTLAHSRERVPQSIA